MATVMIVDDTQDACEPLVKFLEGAGHTARCFANGREALMGVLTAPPDVILLDLVMPEMDGPTFLEVIRSYLRLQSLPVVVLTGLPESPMVERVRHLKVSAILVKGHATPADVRRAIEEAMVRLPT